MTTNRTFRYHWLRQIGPAMGTFLTLTGFLFVASKCLEGQLPWLVLLVPAALLAWAACRWLSITAFKLTIDRDGRLWCHRGIWGPDNCLPVLFARMAFDQTPVGYLFDYGNLTLSGQPEYKLRCIGQFSEMRAIIEAGRQETQPPTPWPSTPQVLVLLSLLQQQRPYGPRAIQEAEKVVDGEFRVLQGWPGQEEPWNEDG